MANVTDVEDGIDQVVASERTIERDGAVIETATFRLALVSKPEFELLLQAAGWSDWTAYGGFDRRPLADGAREIVWIVEK